MAKYDLELPYGTLMVYYVLFVVFNGIFMAIKKVIFKLRSFAHEVKNLIFLVKEW